MENDIVITFTRNGTEYAASCKEYGEPNRPLLSVTRIYAIVHVANGSRNYHTRCVDVFWGGEPKTTTQRELVGVTVAHYVRKKIGEHLSILAHLNTMLSEIGASPGSSLMQIVEGPSP